MAKRRILHTLKLDRIAAVDSPCQEHALVAIMKRRADDPEADDAPLMAIHKATFSEALAGQLIADRVRDVFWKAFENKYQADEAFRRALVDDLVSGGDGSAPSADYVAAVAMMAAAAVSSAREIGAKATDEELEAAVEKALSEYVSTKQETTMTTLTTKALLLAAVAKFDPNKTTLAEVHEIQKAAQTLDCVAELPVALAPVADASGEITKLKAEMAKRDAVAALPADVRKHYDGLAEADQDAFLAKTADERASIVADINKGDPILFTMADGTEIRKSDGATALIMAKRLDQQEKVITGLVEKGAASEIEKKCAVYKHVPVTVVKRMLKSAEGGTEADMAEVEQSLKAMDEANKRNFVPGGSSQQPATGGDMAKASAQSRMDAIVKRIATENQISEHQATIKASEDAEWQDLYRQTESLVEDD